MAAERETNDLRQLADRLRGLDQQTAGAARRAGRQLSQQGGKVQGVSAIGPPSATPVRVQAQSAPGSAARYRHILDKQQQQLVSGPPGARPGEAAAKLQEPAKAPQQERGSQGLPDKSVSAGAKDKALADVAKGLREAGVSGGKEAGEIAAPKQAAEVKKEASRGRGR